MKILLEKEHPRVGTVLYRDSPRAKVVNITLKPFLPVFVSVPRGTKVDTAESALEENLTWVLREQEKMSRIEDKFTIFDFGDVYEVKGRPIHIIKADIPNAASRLESKTCIYIYEDIQPREERNIQSFIQEVIIEEMRSWCRSSLPGIVKQLAEKYNVPVRKTIIRNSITRWGSMGKNNDINLSLYLAQLPDHLIEYVILHEFAHIKVKDHSKRYWDHLSSFTVQAKELDRELREYALGVI